MAADISKPLECEQRIAELRKASSKKLNSPMERKRTQIGLNSLSPLHALCSQ